MVDGLGPTLLNFFFARWENSQVARQNHLIFLAKTPFTKRTSRRPPLTAHPNPPRRPAVQRTKTARSDARKIPVPGLSRSRGRKRPQATAGDRRRASASAATKNKKTARLHGTQAPPRLTPATWDFAHERAAEIGGGEWRPSHKAAQRSAGRMTGDRSNGDIPFFHATGSHGPDVIQ